MKLRVGDVVDYKGNFGQDATKKAKITRITINARDKDIDVDHIDWKEVKGRQVIVSLDNGSWAYAKDISPTNRTNRLQFKADVEAELDKQCSKAKDKILKAMNSGCMDLDQDSPNLVIALTCALLQDQADEIVPKFIGGKFEKNFKAEVENILRFL